MEGNAQSQSVPLVETPTLGISQSIHRPMVGGNATRRLRRIDPRVREHLIVLIAFIDVVVVFIAMVAAFYLRFDTPIKYLGVHGVMTPKRYVNFFVFGTLALSGILFHLKFYEQSLLLRFKHLVTILTKAIFYWTFGFLSATLLIDAQPAMSRMFGVLSGVTIFIFLFIVHALFRKLILRDGIVENIRQRILFVGWNDQTARIVDSFANAAESAYHFVGCVISSDGHHEELLPSDVPNLGQINDIADLIDSQMIDMVILSDVNCANGEILGLANLCEKEMVQFKIIPGYFQILVSGLHLETVSGVPVLGVTQLALDKFGNAFFKRSVDIVGAIVGLILSAPLIAIFGYLVYRESPGPIFYRQKRLGRNGALFDIIKIRSMRLDAEADLKPGWSTKNDPRRLKIGGLIRRLNIDEVPQFWNVLIGEMSLVGPRPERPELIENFKEEIPHYNARHTVKPGITGWAQVQGLRGDTDLPARISADIYYLENWNPFFDLLIMLKTFAGNKNAA